MSSGVLSLDSGLLPTSSYPDWLNGHVTYGVTHLLCSENLVLDLVLCCHCLENLSNFISDFVSQVCGAHPLPDMEIYQTLMIKKPYVSLFTYVLSLYCQPPILKRMT